MRKLVHQCADPFLCCGILDLIRHVELGSSHPDLGRRQQTAIGPTRALRRRADRRNIAFGQCISEPIRPFPSDRFDRHDFDIWTRPARRPSVGRESQLDLTDASIQGGDGGLPPPRWPF